MSIRALITATVALAVASVASAAGDATSWTGTWIRPKNEIYVPQPLRFTLVQQGTLVTGKHKSRNVESYCDTGSGGAIRGRVRGQKLVGRITWPHTVGTLEMTLSSDGNEITGMARFDRGQCKNLWYPFNATRVRTR